MRLCGVLLALCVIAIGPAAAQTPAGAQLRGRVVDQSGLVMPGAEVAVTNEASSDTRRAVTDTDGRFVFADVPAGTYTVTVDVPRTPAGRVCRHRARRRRQSHVGRSRADRRRPRGVGDGHRAPA